MPPIPTPANEQERLATLERHDILDTRPDEAFDQITELAREIFQVEEAEEIVLITEAEPLSDPGPRIVYVNPAFTEITGYTRSEAIGATPRILQGPDTSRETLDEVREALETRETIEVDLLNRVHQHDLRRDVTTARGWADLLTDHRDDEVRQRAGCIVQASSQTRTSTGTRRPDRCRQAKSSPMANCSSWTRSRWAR